MRGDGIPWLAARRSGCPEWRPRTHIADPDVGRLLGCVHGKTQNLRFGLAQGGGWAAKSPGNWAVRGTVADCTW
jgi:hypothetical protein